MIYYLTHPYPSEPVRRTAMEFHFLKSEFMAIYLNKLRFHG